MKRIICHWTAGTYRVSDLDKTHYHFIIDGDGNVIPGTFRPEANLKPVKGKYAAHTLNCNTGSIGVSVACMAGATEAPYFAGSYPMKKAQWDRMTLLVAELAKKYGIPITPETVLSHAEVQGTLKIPQRGKWDFTRLAFDPAYVGAKECGDKLRADAKAVFAPKPISVSQLQEPPRPAVDAIPTAQEETTSMNTNAIHNLLNFVGLIIGSLVTFDWAGLGLSPTVAALVAGWVLMADKVIKLAMNITRDGIGGLFKTQPPVK